MNNFIYKTAKTYIKTSLLFSCALHLSVSTALCGQFQLDDIDAEAYRTHYNNLPSVQESDGLLKESSQFHSFLKEAEEIITRHELESLVGLRLIHRHLSLGKNQVMAEEYEVVNNTPSLVTSAFHIEEAKAKGAVPASWIFSGNIEEDPIVFEASTDAAVKLGSSTLQDKPDFMQEMSMLLHTKGLNNLFAVSLLKRDALTAKEDQMYVEQISTDEKLSILQLGYEQDQPSNMIRTSWSFKGPKKYGCINFTICQPLPTGGHLNIIYHQKV